MAELKIEVKDESEKSELRETIANLFGDANFPGKDDSNKLLIRASPGTISILQKLAKIKVVGA